MAWGVGGTRSNTKPSHKPGNANGDIIVCARHEEGFEFRVCNAWKVLGYRKFRPLGHVGLGLSGSGSWEVVGATKHHQHRSPPATRARIRRPGTGKGGGGGKPEPESAKPCRHERSPSISRQSDGDTLSR